MDLVATRTFAQERRPIRHVDWFLLLITLALCVVGLLLVYSATSQTLRQGGFDPFDRANKQAITMVLGVFVLLLLAAVDYRFLKIYAGFIYIASMASLLLVRLPGIGSTDPTGTAQRWFAVGPFQITPSEFTKLALIITLGAVLANIRTPEPTLRDIGKVLLLAAIPLGLVFLGPDIGTSIAITAIVVGMLIVAGTKLRHLIVLCLVGIIGIVLVFQTNLIKDFQRERLTAFINSQSVSADVRYNLDQSLIAVGSGGLLGKGYLHGIQTNLDYVPEQHTDFIFTVAGEEFGFVGAIALLALYALLVWRAIRIAWLAKDPFGTYVAAGIASMFAIQMFVNVGMVIGIMPITGIPLPFLSYGGTSILASFAAVGLLQSIHMRRFT
ncbi:MAG TPA: rod shape-determining protein RodA [Actinomycetota bacterium]|jgi:rod shape determining protein RodA|nr:rod shape-determining protein RodA [Actinomycetota bacterium]